MTQIIGISGKIGTGKTTIAKEIVNLPGWAHYSFGDLLKSEVSKIFNIPTEWCYKYKNGSIETGVPVFTEKKRYTPPKPTMTIREVLQWYGTDVRRSENPDYWVGRLMDKIRREQPAGAVIDDVRLENEAQAIKDASGKLIRINPYPAWSCPEEIAKHPTETDLDSFDGWDLVINPNYGGLDLFVALIEQKITDWGVS